MQIHHLSCGTMCPFGGRLWDGHSPVLGPAEIVCHCLLVETEIGLVLVDTGFGRVTWRNRDGSARFFELPIGSGCASRIPLCGKSKTSVSRPPICGTSY